MKTKFFLFTFLFLGGSFSVVPAQGKSEVKEFPLEEVRLLDGPFKHACDLDIQVLLQYDTDRLLAPYFKEAGLPLKGFVFLSMIAETRTATIPTKYITGATHALAL